MSILIKGMRMPTSCYDCNCFIRDSDGSDYCCLLMQDIEDNDKRDDNCPLVHIPPHGRLIDADEFLKRAIGTKCFRGDYALMLEELVGESVTIIPADVPENNVGNIPAEEGE